MAILTTITGMAIGAWRATGPRVDLGSFGLTAPVHIGEPYKIGMAVEVSKAQRVQLSNVSFGDQPPTLQSRFWVHAGSSTLGTGHGYLGPTELLVSRPAPGAEVRNGDTLIATLVFGAPGTYRVGSVKLQLGDGLRRRVEIVPVTWCFIVVEPTQALSSVDHAACE